ncbi:MAG: hypothetical protein J2P36_28315, partial [Ktedonobacteraceae bacterium]|nr:hypothetical protein [Ktedonobacteraceae bacterium]
SHFYGAIEAGTTQGIFRVSRVDLAARFVLSALNWTYLWPKPREPYNLRTADQYVQLILHALQAGQLPQPFLSRTQSP